MHDLITEHLSVSKRKLGGSSLNKAAVLRAGQALDANTGNPIDGNTAILRLCSPASLPVFTASQAPPMQAAELVVVLARHSEAMLSASATIQQT